MLGNVRKSRRYLNRIFHQPAYIVHGVIYGMRFELQLPLRPSAQHFRHGWRRAVNLIAEKIKWDWRGDVS